jgi:hypothetical protein
LVTRLAGSVTAATATEQLLEGALALAQRFARLRSGDGERAERVAEYVTRGHSEVTAASAAAAGRQARG